MTKTTARKLVARLARLARLHAADRRTHPDDRHYFQGLTEGYLVAARIVAHEAYGQNKFKAKTRRALANPLPIVKRVRCHRADFTTFATGRAA